MSYWHQMYRRRQPAERVEVENAAVRFESLLSKGLSDGDLRFVESLHKQWQDQGKLSPKQVEILGKKEEAYSEEAIAARNSWRNDYRSKHRDVALICARYYRNTQYFRDLASNILLDEDFVPTQRQFQAMTKNKFAKKAIVAATEPPLFPVGSLVKIRGNANLVPQRSLHNELAVVVENVPGGLYARSKVLVNGNEIQMEDRCLKKA